LTRQTARPGALLASRGSGGISMIEAAERQLLRHRALRAWDEAKRLRQKAADLISASGDKLRVAEQVLREAADLRRVSEALRARSIDIRRPGTVTHLLQEAASPAPTVSPALLEALVDQTIRRWDPVEEEETEANGEGVGLVASINWPTLMRLQQLAGTRLGYVVGAHDAGAALGLAIATQPDLSIIDTRLDLADGSDLVAVLPFYAPRTKTLLLTDDRDIAARAQLTGAEIMPRRFSDQAMLSWISNAVA